MKEVEINYLVAEHLYERDFPDYLPVPKLQISNHDLNDAEFKNFHLLSDEVKLVDKGFWKNNYISRYKEKLSGAHDRVVKIAE